MFLGRVNDYVTVANTAIPFVTAINSNARTSNSVGNVSIRRPGYYLVDADLTITGVAGDVVATIFADGVATQATATATLTAATDFANLSITDAVRVAIAQFPDVATISVVLDTAGVVVDGSLRVVALS